MGEDVNQELNRYLRVEQYIQGGWVNIIDTPIEKPENVEELTDEMIPEIVEAMTDYLFKVESVHVGEGNCWVIFYPKQGPVRVTAIKK